MLQLAPEDEPPPPTEVWKPDRVPTDVELLAYAASSIVRQPWRLVKTARRTIESTLRVRERNRRPDVDPPPGLFNAPRTSFNVALTPHRDFAFTSLSLPDVKMVKNALAVSVNDVVLGLCAGALRKYLEHVGEHPDGPLVAMVPVSVRTEEQKGAHGNQVSSMLCSLATDVDDPVERLLTIHAGTTEAKEQINIIGAEALTDWVEFAAPALLGRAVRLYSRTRMADRHRPLFNVTVSNVPGPPFPLYSAGARMIAHYPMGPIFDGGGLNITLMSYMDSLDFGLVACSDVVDDVWFIAEALTEALDELTKAADARSRPVRS
jgi:WS/DGAT/MGAT family acyltransferase